jgi:arsenate reductase
MGKEKILFLCVHNACRSQIAEALGKHFWGDRYEFYSAGTETKAQINQDAVAMMKRLYGIDMEKSQYSKTIDQVPAPDFVISMGCEVGCPYVGRALDDNWGIEDPTGKGEECFVSVIGKIAEKIRGIEDIIQGKRDNNTK